MPKIEFTNCKIDRKFTQEWSQSGFINLNELPEMVASVIEQRKSMVEYIDKLHDTIDLILDRNNCCDICFVANCGSDHK